LLSSVAARHDIDRILRVSSLLIDGVAVPTADSARALSADAVVDVLPPFAGG
jgi:molybdopterin converting factor small subunit